MEQPGSGVARTYLGLGPAVDAHHDAERPVAGRPVQPRRYLPPVEAGKADQGRFDTIDRADRGGVGEPLEPAVVEADDGDVVRVCRG